MGVPESQNKKCVHVVDETRTLEPGVLTRSVEVHPATAPEIPAVLDQQSDPVLLGLTFFCAFLEAGDFLNDKITGTIEVR